MSPSKRRARHKWLLGLGLLLLVLFGFWSWSPGERVTDGRHDRGRNAIWLGHGWLGANSWFERYRKDPTPFRSERKVAELSGLLRSHGIRTVYPHLCPASPDGTIAPVDGEQTERFLDAFAGLEVLPWVGGVLGQHCFPDSVSFRQSFVSSITSLLRTHPRLGGIHLNIEPMPSGNPDFLVLLDELRAAIPRGRRLSVAAYPPPSLLHPFPAVHWDEPYYRGVSRRADQLAVMMYDTALPVSKLYQNLMAQWTEEILTWAPRADVLLGVPVYDDRGVGYHDPDVENLRHALLGIHAGLDRFASLPSHYAGIALYSEWEMTNDEWLEFREEFEQPPKP